MQCPPHPGIDQGLPVIDKPHRARLRQNRRSKHHTHTENKTHFFHSEVLSCYSHHSSLWTPPQMVLLNGFEQFLQDILGRGIAEARLGLPLQPLIGLDGLFNLAAGQNHRCMILIPQRLADFRE